MEVLESVVSKLDAAQNEQHTIYMQQANACQIMRVLKTMGGSSKGFR